MDEHKLISRPASNFSNTNPNGLKGSEFLNMVSLDYEIYPFICFLKIMLEFQIIIERPLSCINLYLIDITLAPAKRPVHEFF